MSLQEMRGSGFQGQEINGLNNIGLKKSRKTGTGWENQKPKNFIKEWYPSWGETNRRAHAGLVTRFYGARSSV
jgi:hypothetical protein